jgi:hypothetical protein
MSFQLILESLLVLHLVGIVLMAGITLFHFFTLSSLNKHLLTDRDKSMSLLEEFIRLSPWIGIGGMLIILSGTGMVWELKEGVTQALWFKCKMPLVAIMILNAAWLSKRFSHQLQHLLGVSRMGGLSTDASAAIAPENALQQAQFKLRMIYTIQVLLMLVIFTLSIFKFR